MAALKEIKRRSPHARVLLVDYLDAIPERGCWPIVPITNTDMAYLHSVFVKLNDMLAEAARRGGAELVGRRPLSEGHPRVLGPADEVRRGARRHLARRPRRRRPRAPERRRRPVPARSVLAQLGSS